jgi:hypothetical protein
MLYPFAQGGATMTLQADALTTHFYPGKLVLLNRVNPHGKFQDTPLGGFDVQ